MRSRFIKLLCYCVSSIIVFVILVNLSNKESRLHTFDYELNEQIDDERTLEILREFTDLVGHIVNICVIEPYLLWNVLSESDKQLLGSKGFKARKRGKEISVAILKDDLEILTATHTKSLLEANGFFLDKYKSEFPWEDPLVVDKEGKVTSHLLHLRRGLALHILVFYEREDYMWTWRLNHVLPKHAVDPSLFEITDSIFSKFQFVPFPKQDIANLFVPSDIKRFLFQIATSPFIKCANIIVASTTSTTKTDDEADGDDEGKVATRSLRDFEETTILIVKEMRKLLDPSLTQFWLACGTLLGWYRHCGLIPHTTDLDFAAWATDLNGKLIRRFINSTGLTLTYILGKAEEDFEFWMRYGWLTADLFFTYTMNNTDQVYIGSHQPGYDRITGYGYKCVYPKFLLCSTDFLGYRVLVPCTAEAVIEAEYGKDWRVPIEEWYPAQNIMGRRYWDDEERKSYKMFAGQWEEAEEEEEEEKEEGEGEEDSVQNIVQNTTL